MTGLRIPGADGLYRTHIESDPCPHRKYFVRACDYIEGHVGEHRLYRSYRFRGWTIRVNFRPPVKAAS